MRNVIFMFTALAVTRIAAAAGAQPEPATMPYRALCQIARLDFKETAGFTNRHVSFKVVSKNPNVKLADIAIFVDARSGRIPLAITTNGIMDLPISPELMEENPNIVANQPKGSMTMKATVAFGGKLAASLAKSEEGLIRYSGLFVTERMKRQMAHDLTELGKEYNLGPSLEKPTIAHIRFTNDIETADVTILARDGVAQLKPVEPGHFIVRFDPKLMKDDPWVRLNPNRGWSIKMEIEADAEPRRP